MDNHKPYGIIKVKGYEYFGKQQTDEVLSGNQHLFATANVERRPLQYRSILELETDRSRTNIVNNVNCHHGQETQSSVLKLTELDMLSKKGIKREIRFFVLILYVKLLR